MLSVWTNAGVYSVPGAIPVATTAHPAPGTAPEGPLMAYQPASTAKQTAITPAIRSAVRPPGCPIEPARGSPIAGGPFLGGLGGGRNRWPISGCDRGRRSGIGGMVAMVVGRPVDRRRALGR